MCVCVLEICVNVSRVGVGSCGTTSAHSPARPLESTHACGSSACVSVRKEATMCKCGRAHDKGVHCRATQCLCARAVWDTETRQRRRVHAPPISRYADLLRTCAISAHSSTRRAPPNLPTSRTMCCKAADPTVGLHLLLVFCAGSPIFKSYSKLPLSKKQWRPLLHLKLLAFPCRNGMVFSAEGKNPLERQMDHARFHRMCCGFVCWALFEVPISRFHACQPVSEEWPRSFQESHCQM